MKTVNCSLAACIVLAFASLTAAAQNTTFSLVRLGGRHQRQLHRGRKRPGNH